VIEIRDLHKAFAKKEVLKGINLNLDKPGITAILGPNASGKTTLIKCILGMVIPGHGEIEINGKSVLKEWAYRDTLDYLPQIARFPDNLKVRELVKMIQSFRNRPDRSEELIEYFGLEPALEQRLGHLSGGTRQKVNIVVAFMYDNPIMILDEPSAGLDPVALQLVKKLVKSEKEKGKLILITTHIMNLVEELADEIVFLLDGVIHFRGTTQALLSEYGEDDVEKSIARLLERNNEKEA
jgi:Cu-processing system ATP-binding protein